MGVLELEILAPMIVAIVLILTVGGVVLLRPLSRRLGELLEVMAREREQPRLGEDMARLREVVDTVNGRLALLEERLDFTDALLADPERRRLRPGDAARDTPAAGEGSDRLAPQTTGDGTD